MRKKECLWRNLELSDTVVMVKPSIPVPHWRWLVMPKCMQSLTNSARIVYWKVVVAIQGQAFQLVFCDYCADVTLATQYCLTATSIFSGTRGPSSWSTILVSHLIPSTNFFTLIKTSTSSRNITAPSGRKIRSISRRMSSSLHLHLVITHDLQHKNEHNLINGNIWT